MAKRPSGLPTQLREARVSALHDSKDIRAASSVPGFPGPISLWAWRFYTHRLTPAGRWFCAAAFLFLLFGSTSFELQVFVPFAYVFGAGVVVILAVFLVQPSAELHPESSDRVQAGDVLTVTLHVTNRGKRFGEGWSVAPFRLPPSIDPLETAGVALDPIPAGGSAAAVVHLKCYARGRYLLRGWRVQTDVPFGLLRAYTFVKTEKALLVTPQFRRLSHVHLPMGRRHQPGGIALASSLGDTSEYLGNRDYREGDRIRDIDWRATARMDRPIVREYREEYFHRVALLLDTQIASGASISDDFERAVSITASVCDWLARQDYVVDLFAAGPEVYHLTAGRSLAYTEQILEILACLTPSPAPPFDRLEPEIFEILSTVTTVICVFLNWDETRRQLAERLRAEGSGVKIILVGDHSHGNMSGESAQWESFSTISGPGDINGREAI